MPDHDQRGLEGESPTLPAQSDAPPAAPTQAIQDSRCEITPGTLIACRYEIIESLGQGGMGRVYKAFDREVKDMVSLKLIRPEIAADSEMIERFRNETKLARAISHRNVCRTYDLGKVESEYYLTMEFVAGEDLKTLIRRSGALSLDRIAHIGRQIAEGLAEAHRLGVVHRDMKPQNIMIDGEGNARVMDFGLARSAGAEGLTRTGAIVGTPDYMSPEQWEGKTADARSDIYAFGAILYEMATGQKPFAGETSFIIGLKHRSEMPKDPRLLNPTIPRTLCELILTCLEKEPPRRPPTMEAVAAKLGALGKELEAATEPNLVGNVSKTVAASELARSVGVLPFIDLSEGKDQEYFCEGIAEELIHSLAKIRDLHVAARTSAFSFKGQTSDIREIGRKLNVDTILQGSVRKAGDRLRITAQLVSVADGYHLWSERYDRQLQDIFAIQDEVTQAIIDHLKLTLVPHERQAVFNRGTNDLEAHALFLKGLHYLWMYSGRGYTQAIRCFEEAIQRDPGYARAFWGLSDAYLQVAFWGSTPPLEACPKVKACARKALEIDPTLGDAHGALSYVHTIHDWNWEAAEREAKEALRLSPNSAMVHAYHSWFLLNTERFEEGVAAAMKAKALDPVSSFSAFALGIAFGMCRDFSRAIQELQAGIKMNPDFYILQSHLGMTCSAKGRYAEAISAHEKAVEISGRIPFFLASLAMAYEQSGRKAEADGLWRELEERTLKEYVPPTCFFLKSVLRGNLGQAWHWLKMAGKTHDSYLSWFRILPREYIQAPGESPFKAGLKKAVLRMVIGRIMARHRIVGEIS